MKKSIIISLVVLIISLCACCTRVEGPEQDLTQMEMIFEATIEGPSDTKTVLDGEVGDPMRYIKWHPEDSIGISRQGYSGYSIFRNVNEEIAETGIFKGNIESASTYYSIFPYDIIKNFSSNTYTVELPMIQYYQPNSFGREAYPMAGKKTSNDKHIIFQNLCGVIVLNLLGSETIESITFSAKNAEGKPLPVCGQGTVSMNQANYSTITMSGEDNIVTLVCEDGVTLDPVTPTPFHIVLPPATYSSFTVTVVTTDGKIMVKESARYIEIKRSIVTTTGALTLDGTTYEEVDLSPDGTANSYIVSNPGVYSFDASVKGNGMGSDAYLSPESAELLWADNLLVVTNVIYDEGSKKIKFTTTGYEGNAVIAAKDADGNIIWSWHIWCTDQPAEHIYSNNAGTLMDRNLGAVSATPGDPGALGLYYQWGRKDPFVGSAAIGVYTPKKTTYKWPGKVASNESRGTIEYSIEHPTTYIDGNNDWLYISSSGNNRWNHSKTIYDPCPPGWRVPDESVWMNAGLTSSFDTSNKGLTFTGGVDNNAWYPASGYLASNYPTVTYIGSYGDYWSCSNGYYNYEKGSLGINSSGWRSTVYACKKAQSVRCQKDESYNSSSVPTVVIDSIATASASAEIYANITYSGWSDITEMGVVYSTTPEPTLESGIKVSHTEADRGVYTISIEELASTTKYYVRAFATNGAGTSYSDEKYFVTHHNGGSTDLCTTGTANSYIITSAGTYSIRPVKGNSDTLLSSINRVEVVWESFGTATTPEVGDLVKLVTLDESSSNIVFVTSDTYKEGNALIAAKDAKGTILWSWHLWFTDQPAEHTYPNDAGIMMDRNLGAITATPGEDGVYGLIYQWGRKDPFLGKYTQNKSTKATSTGTFNYIDSSSEIYGTIEYSTEHPTTFIMTYSNNNYDWLYINNSVATDTTRWSTEKTIYDPCPVGWRVPNGGESGFWATSGIAPSITHNQGGIKYTDSVNGQEYYYPYTGRYDEPYDATSNDISYYYYGWYWTCTNTKNNIYRADYMEFDSSSLTPYHTGTFGYRYYGHAVRCQKIQ